MRTPLIVLQFSPQDRPEASRSFPGAELLQSGLLATAQTRPQALVFTYEKQ